MAEYVRKIKLMHKMFGRLPGRFCRDCCNLCKVGDRTRTYSKCNVYGCTSSEASDWSQRNEACGMFNKEWKKLPVMRLAYFEKDNAIITPLDGQEVMKGF